MSRSYIIALATAILSINVAGGPLNAEIVAYDDSADSAYEAGWSNGSDGGFGFSSWTLRKTGTTSQAGFITGSSSNNDNGGPATSHKINASDGDSFGMYANSGNNAVGYRSFSLVGGGSSLPISGTFSWKMDNGGIAGGGGSSVGLSLRNGDASADSSDSTIVSGERFAFRFVGGESSYSYVDSDGVHATGISFRRTGLNLTFTLTGIDTYSFSIVDTNTTATLGAFSGTLAGTAGTSLDSFAIYNRNAGANTERNAYFNAFSVSAVPEASSFLFGGLICGVISAVAIRRRRVKQGLTARN